MLSRIQQILKSKNLTPSKFAEEIGVQRSAMSHILSGRNNPSLEFIQKVLSHFPDINTDWLMTGNGKMYNDMQLFKPEVISFQELNINEKNQTDKKIQNSKELKIEPELPSPTVKKPLKASPLVKTALSKEKTIDKIVIFYSDKTFSEYYPEN